MSETVARQRSSIDLDDFERRFRETAHPAQGSVHASDDPLAELARIVGDEPDPYANVFAQPAARSPSYPSAQQDFRPSFAPHARPEPSFADDKPRFSADFAAIEAGLRGALAQSFEQHPHDQVQPQLAPGHDLQADYAEPDYAFPPESQTAPAWADPVRAPAGPGLKRGAARKPVYVIAGSIALAVVGIGVAFAYKGTGSSPREIKTIMAAAGPTKIQPPADAKADASDQDDSTLGQGQAPTKLVSREEQPVDLQQAVQDNAARDAASHGTDAESVPVPPSPGAGTMSPDYSALGGQPAPADSSQSYSDQGFGVGMPLPKKVKSVMVKPDGTIVSDARADVAQPAPAVPAAKSDDRIGALVDGTAPTAMKSAAPRSGRAKAAKSTTRVATAAPAPAADPAEADDVSAPKPAKASKKSKPIKVATAETVADTAADDAKPEGNGGFAVQLAAPGSEADARSATSRLIAKFSGALHGRRLGFHRAESNGRTVYRVRVSSLSKEDALSLCTKLKADGGTCFVAKN